MAAIAESALKPHLAMTGLSPLSSDPSNIKYVAFEVPDTADDGDTITITLATYGLTTMWDCMMWSHTTTDDVIITESTEMVTSVTTGTLTVTIQGSTDNEKRVIVLVGV